MPRYFFDVTDTGETSRDDQGFEFASLEDARREALRALGGIVKDELPDGNRCKDRDAVRIGGPLSPRI